MPLEAPDRKHLNAAIGFFELEMFEEANAELEDIDSFCRHLPEVLSASWDCNASVAICQHWVVQTWALRAAPKLLKCSLEVLVHKVKKQRGGEMICRKRFAIVKDVAAFVDYAITDAQVRGERGSAGTLRLNK